MYNSEIFKNQNPNIGDTIRIIKMEDGGGSDSQANKYAGKEGVIDYIDNRGLLHGTWGSLAVIPEIDEFEIIARSELPDFEEDLDNNLNEAKKIKRRRKKKSSTKKKSNGGMYVVPMGPIMPPPMHRHPHRMPPAAGPAMPPIPPTPAGMGPMGMPPC